jgi:hypothetical protein
MNNGSLNNKIRNNQINKNIKSNTRNKVENKNKIKLDLFRTETSNK